MPTDIRQLLSSNIYKALVGAAAPSSGNVFATIADVVSVAGLTTNVIPEWSGTAFVNSSITDDLAGTVTVSSELDISSGNGLVMSNGYFTMGVIIPGGGETTVWDVHNLAGGVKWVTIGNKGSVSFPLPSQKISFGSGSSTINNASSAANAVLNHFTIGANTSVLLGSDATGDMYYNGGSGVLTRLAAGAAGTFLMYNGTSTAPIVSTLVLPNSATSGRVVYATGANTYGESANLIFSGTVLTASGGFVGVTNSQGNNSTNQASTAYVDGAQTYGISPVYSGKWRTFPTTALATSTGWNGFVIVAPIPISVNHTITAIALRVTVGDNVTPGKLRFVLYADNNGYPGAVIEQSGDVAATAAGIVSFTFVTPRAVLAKDKVVWAGFQANSATIQTSTGPTNVYFMPTANGIPVSGFYKSAQSYGVAPDPYPAGLSDAGTGWSALIQLMAQ